MKKTIQINNHIFEKIKFRYHLMDTGSIHNRTVMGRMLLDSFYPYGLATVITGRRTEMITPGGSRDGYCISERVSRDMNARKLHISELVSMLGYTKTDITKLLQAAKNKEYNVALVGLGGTGSNFLHWMYEMCEWTGKKGIFQTITAFDDDSFDVPNMLRIPFIPEFNSTNFTAKKVACIPKRYGISSSGRFKQYNRRMTTDDLKATITGYATNTVVYGAPDIGTREWLSAHNYGFIAATHRDNEFSLVENPDVDNDLMMETYGKINLSMFFLNHLTMTIEFLKHLSTREETFTTTDATKNREILRANFAGMYEDQLEQGFKAGAKKLFAISENEQNTRNGEQMEVR